MKTIAIVLNTTWNIYNFRLSLMKFLKKNGYEVIAISPRDEYVEKLNQEGFKWFNLELDNDSTNPIKEFKTIYDFYKIYKKANPDIILQYTIKPNIYGTIAATFLKIPVINNVSGLGTIFINNNLSSKIAKFLYKISFKYPKKVFFQNHHDKELFIKNHLISPTKADVIPGSGIDTKKFKPHIIKKDNKEFKFLFIGRLIREKGIEEYIDAIRDIKKDKKYSYVKFEIVGDFYPKNPSAISKKYFYSLEKRGWFEYKGFTDDIKGYIEKADCIVLPSYREGLSKTLLEAASMQKPIITTNVPGCKDVVEDGINGFLCQVKNSHDLKEKMIKMLNLPFQKRLQMGKKGREKIITEFSEELVFHKYLSCIKNI